MSTKEFILPNHISLTAMFKTIGNGVPYLASKALASMIKGFLNNPLDKTPIREEKQLEIPLLLIVDLLSLIVYRL